MSRKMTVVFHNEELYTDLKVEAARRHIAASDIVAEAVQQWLDDREDEELLPLIRESIKEYEEKGGKPWEEVDKELEAEHQKGNRRNRAGAMAPKEKYTVTLAPSAERDIEELRQNGSTEEMESLRKAIMELAANPRPAGARRIKSPDEIKASHIRPRN